MKGGGADGAVASAVAAEIEAAGGAALADEHDVASPEGAEALVDAALERFGRLDILINNAGIMQWGGLPEVDADNLQRHLAVHVLGSFNTTRAAWPTMVDQGYGRIVMTTSSGVFGLPKNLSYATAKGGVIGLTRSIATTSEAHGIKVNLIAPAAMTRMAGPDADERRRRVAHGAGPGGAAGGLPRPRGVPGQRGDVRRRRRPVRPHLHRLHPGLRRHGARPSRTWPRTGTRSTDEEGYVVPARPPRLVGLVPGPPAGRRMS